MPRTIDLARTAYLYVPGTDGIADPKKPTLTELTASGVVNISPLVVQTTEIGATASDTTDERSVIATGNAKTPTVGNYTGMLNMFRELDPATGQPIITGDTDDVDPIKLFPGAGVEHWIVKRSGPAWDAEWTTGQYCEVYGFISDVLQFSGGKQDGFLKTMIALLPTGRFCTTAKVAAGS